MSYREIKEMLDQQLDKQFDADTKFSSDALVAYLRYIADQVEMKQIMSTCSIIQVKELPISSRLKSTLITNGVVEIDDVIKNVKATSTLRIRGVGEKGLVELKEALYSQCGIKVE
ncbi:MULTISPECIES: hypothetical protein [Chromobacterium]|uniref:RNA polymerase alpha subunit C-terminal domain-containing protein n=2 Tax=Chromobacterium TaxID=535 RepID=A0AAD0W9B5_9NEIS|nr:MULTISPECIES: hypothetical protein [Chromobacterium]AXT46598.1 hypothetical protein D1345_10535 [Chromobacterium rhizoryzae]NHR06715.1 hypothetical protein [Chromobacterium haemolyticum]OQS34135.1 hypothetical protein B0T40_16200 [Chromobacterium haemolyticum]QOD84846.1 hypothetical protein IEZ30_10365 [Chromobacterium haemolyticum]